MHSARSISKYFVVLALLPVVYACNNRADSHVANAPNDTSLAPLARNTDSALLLYLDSLNSLPATNLTNARLIRLHKVFADRLPLALADEHAAGDTSILVSVEKFPEPLQQTSILLALPDRITKTLTAGAISGHFGKPLQNNKQISGAKDPLPLTLVLNQKSSLRLHINDRQPPESASVRMIEFLKAN
ncbi:hypothetical protein [Pedobacter sp. SYP-B3415]|uniref:hypothetical protein n=1 Tax=Pedobacter sp. SYP-B3415 TaxID=2496641 RepID=UPI00101CA8FB|nr:hypothetical protein [Pedobacter sp. SYP-B3415]